MFGRSQYIPKFLTPRRTDGEWTFGLYKYVDKFLTTGSLTLVFFLAAAFLIQLPVHPQIVAALVDIAAGKLPLLAHPHHPHGLFL